jgi:hypothetical protein
VEAQVVPEVDLSRIIGPEAQAIIASLRGQLAQVLEALATALAENQQLRDEINRLKGEQGKPAVRPNTVPAAHSSEAERPPEPAPVARPRPDRRLLTIDREEVCRVARETLPPDAQFKDYEDLVVQDLVLHAEVVHFRREKWYAKSTGKTYLAPLPAGYGGHFGPGVKTLALTLYHVTGVSEPKIRELLASVGLEVAASTLSDWLTQEQEAFHAEAQAVYVAGLASSPWQQIDDTETRVNGQAEHCHVVGNPLYASYHTRPYKDRLTVIDLLRPGQEGTHRVDATARALLQEWQVAQWVQQAVALLPQDTLLDRAGMRAALDTQLAALGPRQRQQVREATALAAYRAQTTLPVVATLLSDDAGQFSAVTDTHALCWIHDARHYKKLLPQGWEEQALLATFMAMYWAFYAQLLAYRLAPDADERTRLQAAFVRLFSTVTGYAALDARIAKTLAHQRELLLVLAHPELPLHNNASELAVRRRVRKRDVSFGPRTAAGARGWDTFHTLAATAQKLGVNILHYLHDRVSGVNRLPSLASLITERAQTADLGASWAAANCSTTS